MKNNFISVRPIITDQDHSAAVKRIDALMDAQSGTREGEELDILATLVVAYEEKRWPMKAPDPITLIQFQMEHQGLTRKDLEPLIGSRARVSEVLSHKRSLTLPMIRRVRAKLGISADLLIADVPRPARKRA